MKQKVLAAAAALIMAASGSGCSDVSGMAAALASQQAEGVQPGSRRVIDNVDAEADLPELPTFTFEPIVVATPVPVFADRARERMTAEPSLAATGDESEAMPDAGSQVSESIDEAEPELPNAASGTIYAGRTIAVRWMDVAGGRLMETVYSVPLDSTPEDLMKYVTKGLRAALVDQRIQIVSAEWKDGTVTVDFAPGIYLAELSSADEYQMLEAIADSYLRNVDGIQSVFYTVEGEPYRSEHLELEEGQPYKWLEPAN